MRHWSEVREKLDLGRATEVTRVPAFLVLIILLTGLTQSCKHDPVTPIPDTTHKHDSDTVSHPCDTCQQTVVDTTSHSFDWHESSISTESNLTGCCVVSPTSIYAVGLSLYHFDGSIWSEYPLKDSKGISYHGYMGGFTLFGFSDKDLWFTNGDVVSHFDGNAALDYQMESTGVWRLHSDGALHTAWGMSSSDIFFVGDSGTVLHFDGTTWLKYPKVTTKNLRSVWGTSHNDVWASGFNSSTSETVLLHFDGVQWTEDALSKTKGINATGGFDAVWACDSGNGHHFVTTSGAILLRRIDQRAWRSDSGLISNRLPDGTFVGITPKGNAANDFFVVGGWGFVSHWNGHDWHQYTDYFDYNDPAYGPAGISVNGNTACIVGLRHGRSWVLVGQRK